MLGRLPRYLQLFGLSGVRTYRALKGRGTAQVHVPGLQAPIHLRCGTSDRSVFNAVFVDRAYQVDFPGEPRLIIDAGANIGLTTVWFAQRWPEADIVAIEPDPGNFALLQANVRHLPRVRTIHAAVWPCRERLVVENPEDPPWSFRVRPARAGELGFAAIDLASVLTESGHATIDVLKLDVEGAERELLSDPGCHRWLDATRMAVTELHDRYKPGCSAALEAAIAGRSFRRSKVGENVVLVREHACTAV